MSRNHRRYALSGFMILVGMVACALPGQAISPAAPSNQIQPTLISTTQATQTKQATATSTTIPTETLVPTPKISLYGTSLVIQEDQSTLFTDHKAGIQLVIPPGWMTLRVNEDEYYKAFALDVVIENPPISDRLTRIQDVNLDYHRLEAIDIRPGHIQDGIISDINVVFEEGDVRTLEEWEKAERNRKSPWADYKFISSSYRETENGTRVLVIEHSWSAGEETIYYRGVFFPLSSGTLVLDFYSNFDFRDTVLPDFEQVVNSVTLLDP
ncbi:MAG TPA: hypothetical protein VGK56_04610 [Anaerolineales bacterium]